MISDSSDFILPRPTLTTRTPSSTRSSPPPKATPLAVDRLLPSNTIIVASGNSANLSLSAKMIFRYASSNDLIFSCSVFDLVPRKDAYLWNSIIKSHFSNGLYAQAQDFYFKMRVFGVFPNGFSVSMAVAACTEQAELGLGMRVHVVVLKRGLLAGDDGCAVWSSLIFIFSKCGEMVSEAKLFEEMTVRDVVAWTTLVIGYVQNGDNEKGLGSLCEMVKFVGVDVTPNFRTMEGGLQACGKYAIQRHPKNDGYYVGLSNICSSISN